MTQKSFAATSTLLLLLAVSSGCVTSLNKSQSAGPLDVHLRSNLAADVEVDMSKKISGNSAATKLFTIFTLSGPEQYADGVSYSGAGVENSGFFGGGVIEEVKAAAAYNAVTAARADVIVAPQYVVRYHSVFFGAYKEVSVQVTGYAGKLKGIKTATE